MQSTADCQVIESELMMLKIQINVSLETHKNSTLSDKGHEAAINTLA